MCIYIYINIYIYIKNKTFISLRVVFCFLPNLQRLNFEGLKEAETETRGIYLYITICNYKYNSLYIYTNLPVSDMVRLPYPRSGDSQGQETFLAHSPDKYGRKNLSMCPL